MKDFCTNCPHGKTRETCTELCAEAEAYANQDYVSQRELRLAPAYAKNLDEDFDSPWEAEREDPTLRLKHRTNELHERGFSQQEIADILDVNQSTISRLLQ